MGFLRRAFEGNAVWSLGFAVGMAILLSGCSELSGTVDGLLGAPSLISSASTLPSPISLVPVGKGDASKKTKRPKSGDKAKSKKGAKVKKKVVLKPVPPGKKRPPGRYAPSAKTARAPGRKEEAPPFEAERDPFREPTEILPTECPPSTPLCKYDRSQLKLVGVIQVSDGGYKGLVEDPDGRGYFIRPGMQIGEATVTQITQKGVTLNLHRTRKDVIMPMFSPPEKEVD